MWTRAACPGGIDLSCLRLASRCTEMGRPSKNTFFGKSFLLSNFVLPSENGLGIAVYRPRVAAQDPHHPAPLTRVNHTTAPRRKRARAPIKYMDDSKTIRWSNSRALIPLGTAEGRSSVAAVRLGARLQVYTYLGSSSQVLLHATRPTLNQEIHGRTLSWRRLVGSGH